jgi:hypothetical protein
MEVVIKKNRPGLCRVFAFNPANAAGNSERQQATATFCCHSAAQRRNLLLLLLLLLSRCLSLSLAVRGGDTFSF